MSPLAHVGINGVLKPFWDLMLRKTNTTLDANDSLRITTEQQKLLQRRTAELVSASCFDTELPDIVKCGLLIGCSSQDTWRTWLCIWPTGAACGACLDACMVLQLPALRTCLCECTSRRLAASEVT